MPFQGSVGTEQIGTHRTRDHIFAGVYRFMREQVGRTGVLLETHVARTKTIRNTHCTGDGFCQWREFWRAFPNICCK